MRSDSEIIARVRFGKTQDYRKLVERYQASVHLLAYRMLGRREDAEDAAQDTFIRAYRSLASYNDEADVWPWLRRIAINCCLKLLPRDFPVDDVEEMVRLEPFADSVETEVFRKCTKESVLKVVAGLPESYRTAVALRYLEDLSTSEIAEILNEPAGTVRVRLHRALRMLSERLVIEDEL